MKYKCTVYSIYVEGSREDIIVRANNPKMAVNKAKRIHCRNYNAPFRDVHGRVRAEWHWFPRWVGIGKV